MAGRASSSTLRPFRRRGNENAPLGNLGRRHPRTHVRRLLVRLFRLSQRTRVDSTRPARTASLASPQGGAITGVCFVFSADSSPSAGSRRSSPLRKRRFRHRHSRLDRLNRHWNFRSNCTGAVFRVDRSMASRAHRPQRLCAHFSAARAWPKRGAWTRQHASWCSSRHRR